MSLLEFFGSQQALDDARKELVAAGETMIANALGNLELDEGKLLAPLEAMGNRLLDRFEKIITAAEDRVVGKLTNLRLTQGEPK